MIEASTLAGDIIKPDDRENARYVCRVGRHAWSVRVGLPEMKVGHEPDKGGGCGDRI